MSNVKMILRCIIGNSGSSVFAGQPVPGTKCQDIWASAASILTILGGKCIKRYKTRISLIIF